jgi:hypothetical protein
MGFHRWPRWGKAPPQRQRRCVRQPRVGRGTRPTLGPTPTQIPTASRLWPSHRAHDIDTPRHALAPAQPRALAATRRTAIAQQR